MEHIMKEIHVIEKNFDCGAEKFVNRHPVIAAIAMFAGMPVLLAGAVAGVTTAVMIPVSMLMGWF